MSVSRRYSRRMWVILRHCLVTFQLQGSTRKDHQHRGGLLIGLLVWRQNFRLPSNRTSVWSRSAEGCLWRSRRPRCAAGSTPTGCEAEPCTAGRLRWPQTVNTDGHKQTHIDKLSTDRTLESILLQPTCKCSVLWWGFTSSSAFICSDNNMCFLGAL